MITVSNHLCIRHYCSALLAPITNDHHIQVPTEPLYSIYDISAFALRTTLAILYPEVLILKLKPGFVRAIKLILKFIHQTRTQTDNVVHKVFRVCQIYN